MVFPESERVVYAVDTLEQVICQLQFPTILAIGSEPPTQFQEVIREAYPLYSRQETAPIPPEVAGMLAQINAPPPETVRHVFSTADERRSVALTPQFVAVVEQSYSEWANLRREIEVVKAALEQIYRPTFYTRIGLRYQDVIDKEGLGLDQEWRELLNPTLAGHLGADEDPIREAVREVTSTVVLGIDDLENAFIRIVHGLGQRPNAEPHIVYSIDADHYTQHRHEGGDVVDVLDRFNRESGNLFRWSVSPALHDALGRRESVDQHVDR